MLQVLLKKPLSKICTSQLNKYIVSAQCGVSDCYRWCYIDTTIILRLNKVEFSFMTQGRRQNPRCRYWNNIKMKCEEKVWAQFTSLVQDRNLYENPFTVEFGEFIEWLRKKKKKTLSHYVITVIPRLTSDPANELCG